MIQRVDSFLMLEQRTDDFVDRMYREMFELTT
jgi:hypothetical protein